MKCYYCKIDEPNEDSLITYNITQKSSKSFHTNCLDAFLLEKNKCFICKKKVTIDNYKIVRDFKDEKDLYVHTECEKEFKEKEDLKRSWDKLYQFVKFDILGYPTSFNLTSQQVLLLKSLTQKTIIGRGQKQVYNSYTYDEIFSVFEYYQNDIINALKYKQFKNDQSKLSYCVAIVRNKINDYLLNQRESQKSIKKTNSIKIEVKEKKYNKTNKVNKDLLDLINNRW